MSGVLIRKGKANGLMNMYIAVPADCTEHESSERFIFVQVPLDKTFKECVDALTCK